jgi:hypothetical protein
VWIEVAIEKEEPTYSGFATKPFTRPRPNPRLAPVTKATVGAMIDDEDVQNSGEQKDDGGSVSDQYELM